MDLTTFIFMLFLAGGLLTYYRIPARFRWQTLLALSMIFLCAADFRNLIFVFAVTGIAWGAGVRLSKIREEGKGDPAREKRTAALAVILLILVLVFSKYIPEGLDLYKKNGSFGGNGHFFRLIRPLGISYYLLMAISYVLDIYWKRDTEEKNYFHLLLFISYFPALIQGPIGRFSMMRQQFFGCGQGDQEDDGEERKQPSSGRAPAGEKKTADHCKGPAVSAAQGAWDNLKAGIPLILWGFFKKMVIADRIAVFVNRGARGQQYGLNVVICLAFYGIDLYCDFSGGIDVIRGISECFGIRLSENFRQPYFSGDLGEFWRRWHISLGAFMKDYVFFPLALWSPFKKLKKRLKKHMSVKAAGRVIVALGDLIVFLIVGVWHGTGSRYAGWGLYNGAILAFSAVMEEVYAKWRTALFVDPKSRQWRIFRLIRTLLIVTVGWVFDVADTASGAVLMFLRMFVLNRTDLGRIFTDLAETCFYLPILFIACMILLWVDIRHEKGISLREYFGSRPFPVQAAVWTFLLQAILLCGRTIGAGGFMYANF